MCGIQAHIFVQVYAAGLGEGNFTGLNGSGQHFINRNNSAAGSKAQLGFGIFLELSNNHICCNAAGSGIVLGNDNFHNIDPPLKNST